MAILLGIPAREAHDEFAAFAEAAAELQRVASRVGETDQPMSHRELGDKLAALHRQGVELLNRALRHGHHRISFQKVLTAPGVETLLCSFSAHVAEAAKERNQHLQAETVRALGVECVNTLGEIIDVVNTIVAAIEQRPDFENPITPLQPRPSGETAETRLPRMDLAYGEKLGSGAFGTVWRGTDQLLERDVAVKFLTTTDQALDEDALIREARSLAKVTHANLVHVYGAAWLRHPDTGLVAPAIMMELLDGEKLVKWWSQQHSRDEAFMVVDGVLQGVAAMHAADIHHGDLHPENVMVLRTGQAKLIDWRYQDTFLQKSTAHRRDLVGVDVRRAIDIVVSVFEKQGLRDESIAIRGATELDVVASAVRDMSPGTNGSLVARKSDAQRDSLLARIERHFDSTYTRPGSDPMPLVMEIMDAVDRDRLSEFFEQVVGVLSTTDILGTNVRPEAWVFFEAGCRHPDAPVRNALVDYLSSHEDLLVAFLRYTPARVLLFAHQAALIRRIWTVHAFNNGLADFSLYAAMLRCGLIPPGDVAGANLDVVRRMRGGAPSPDDAATLSANGFIAAFDQHAFADAFVDRFAWGNQNSQAVRWRLEQYSISDIAVTTICGCFAAEPCAHGPRDAMIQLFGENKAKKAEFLQAATRLSLSLPSQIPPLT